MRKQPFRNRGLCIGSVFSTKDVCVAPENRGASRRMGHGHDHEGSGGVPVATRSGDPHHPGGRSGLARNESRNTRPDRHIADREGVRRAQKTGDPQVYRETGSVFGSRIHQDDVANRSSTMLWARNSPRPAWIPSLHRTQSIANQANFDGCTYSVRQRSTSSRCSDAARSG